ncbi:MAG: hypothetical protein ACRBBP_08410 [Bdellovibrionales bacterium]
MIATTKTVSRILGLAAFLMCSASMAETSGKMICEGAEQTDVAWGMSPSAHRIFTSNLMEPANSRYTKDQKRSAVEKAIRRYHTGAGGYSPAQIARAIIWASDCTGNDFKWFAGIIGNESLYCSTRQGAGGDSGCGQFTGDAIASMKLQLKLPSRQRGSIDTASPRSTQAMRDMVKSCYQRYDGMVDGSEGKGSEALFYNVMDRSHSGLKSVFRRASAMHVDILASAIFLKFNAALAGGYTVSGSRPGGIARYNGGGVSNYLSHIQRHRGKINVDYSCVEDTYTSDVAGFACELDENPETCMSEFEAVHTSDQDGSVEI